MKILVINHLQNYLERIVCDKEQSEKLEEDVLYAEDIVKEHGYNTDDFNIQWMVYEDAISVFDYGIDTPLITL